MTGMNQKKSKDLSKKKLREQQVLLGLVELYLEMGKPIGSNSLREHGFQELSSATIRNYFSDLETQGYLRQPHASGGRVPTNSALRLYAQKVLEEALLTPDVEEKLRPLEELPSRHLMRYLQNGAEILSQVTGYATFFSSVRFDHDLILEIKLVGIDNERILCVIITNFGEVFTEILHINTPSHPELLTQIQSYIQLKIKGDQNAEKLNSPLAQKVYNEIMVRYLVRYSNFSDEDIYRTGFSHLLAYPEFHDPVALTTSLSLFENSSHMRLLLHDCMQEGSLRFWVGKDLAPYASAAQGCTVIAVPYRI